MSRLLLKLETLQYLLLQLSLCLFVLRNWQICWPHRSQLPFLLRPLRPEGISHPTCWKWSSPLHCHGSRFHSCVNFGLITCLLWSRHTILFEPLKEKAFGYSDHADGTLLMCVSSWHAQTQKIFETTTQIGFTVYTQFCWGKSRGEVLHNMVDLPHSKPRGSRSGSGSGEKLNLIWYAQNIFRESRPKGRSLIDKMVKLIDEKLKVIMSNTIALVTLVFWLTLRLGIQEEQEGTVASPNSRHHTTPPWSPSHMLAAIAQT